jgi:hypothetical protein
MELKKDSEGYYYYNNKTLSKVRVRNNTTIYSEKGQKPDSHLDNKDKYIKGSINHSGLHFIPIDTTAHYKHKQEILKSQNLYKRTR